MGRRITRFIVDIAARALVEVLLHGGGIEMHGAFDLHVAAGPRGGEELVLGRPIRLAVGQSQAPRRAGGRGALTTRSARPSGNAQRLGRQA